MFILLSSEKNEPRSAAAVIGLCRSAAGTALGGCGTRCAQTLLALILGWLASSRPDKGGGGTLYASFQSFRATTRYPGEENTRHGLENPAGGEGDKKTPPRRSGEAGVVQCARRVPRVGCYLLSITRVAFFNPLAVASRVILPGSSVEATMAVIMPENTFMRGSWNDSSEVGSPLAPAR